MRIIWIRKIFAFFAEAARQKNVMAFDNRHSIGTLPVGVWYAAGAHYFVLCGGFL